MRARLSFCAGLLALMLSGAAQAAACAVDWPQWQSFAERWVQPDGRVLESALVENHSSSEGQSYALFFSLVANDKERFDKIWRWSRQNLAGNDPQNILPAWLWGQGKDGRWQVQDANSASDADLWFVYALLEADRLWRKPEYRADAMALLAQIKEKETKDLPGLGRVLLPGPIAFSHIADLWRINSSYQPLPLMRRLQAVDPQGPWQNIAGMTATLQNEAGPHGFAVDWLGYRAVSGEAGLFARDPEKGDVGSYDAIRVYLWAGMTDPADPLAKPLLDSLYGMARATASTGLPPEKVDVRTGAFEGQGHFGFSAALVPYFHAKGQPLLAAVQYKRAAAGLQRALSEPTPPGELPAYYNIMLGLFGLGWVEKRFIFRADGSVQLFWESACSVSVH